MNNLSPEFIRRLKAIRERAERKRWLYLAARYRETSEAPCHKMAADLAQIVLNPDSAWSLRQLFKEHGVNSWSEIATAFEVVDAWVDSSPTAPDIIWSGPANGAFPIRRTDQVLYDYISKAKSRVFLVTFAAHRVHLLNQNLAEAIDRGVDVTLLLESEQTSAGQLSQDAAKAFKELPLHKVRLLHWPIEKRERNQAGKPGKLHVKCAIIDNTVILGSANLTDDAFNRNMEMGVVIRDVEVVSRICEHFETLERTGVLKRA